MPASTVPPPARAAAPVDTRHVTVVLPTYNRKESLRRCLEGLFACDVEGLVVDVWVIDDGSGDGTGEMFRELAAAYRGPLRLRYHRQENAGHSAAVNTGIRLAETDLVLNIDDDCAPHPRWIRALVETPWDRGIGAVGGQLVGVERGNWVTRYCRFLKYNEFPPDDGPVKFVNSASSCYLRQALDEVGGFETLLCLGGEDIEVAWRMVLAGYRLVYQPEAINYHYHRETLRALAKTFYTRGYARTLRNLLWGAVPHPTWGWLAHEAANACFSALRGVLIPLRAARYLRQGVAPADALPFAYLNWLQRGIGRCGKVRLLWRVLRGRQTLERTGRVPEGAGDPSLAPAWALGKNSDE